jgi:hypothetical protein
MDSLAAQQRQLATVFVEEARRELHRVLALGGPTTDPTWRAAHLEALTYWSRAYRHYRECHEPGARAEITAA